MLWVIIFDCLLSLWNPWPVYTVQRVIFVVAINPVGIVRNVKDIKCFMGSILAQEPGT